MKNKFNNDKLFFSMVYEFLEVYLPKQRGRSKHTILSYKDSLSIFRRYLLDQKGISIVKFTFKQCIREIIIDFLDFLSKNSCSNSTRNYRLAAIKSYLSFAAEKDIALQSIALSIQKIKQTSKIEPLRICMSDNAISAILSQPDVTKSIGIRDCTLLVLLYDSAVRLGELLNLRIGNVSL
jgi:site-specific recombinase XerD